MISGLMTRPIHRAVRDLHLYFGLFVSPFVVVFACSVIFLVHAWMPGAAAASHTREVTNLPLEPGLGQLSGRSLIDALRLTLDAAGLHGEVGWVQHSSNPNRYIFPVSVPGRTATVTIDVDRKQASIEERTTGIADAVVMLHKSPGPHLVGMRMNWFFMRVWWWLSDATVYLLLFATTSGIYLWLALRRDRRPGLFFAVCGLLSFVSIIYALIC
jgi:hypothetical protein